MRIVVHFVCLFLILHESVVLYSHTNPSPKNCWKEFPCCESTHRSATLEDRFLSRMLEKTVPFLMYTKHFLKKLVTLGFIQVEERKMQKKKKNPLKIQFSVVLGCDHEYLCHISLHLFPNPPADQPIDQQNEQRRNSGEWKGSKSTSNFANKRET